jgi:hypothetical protein
MNQVFVQYPGSFYQGNNYRTLPVEKRIQKFWFENLEGRDHLEILAQM